MAFEKGKSGNPAGRVKEKPFAAALRMAIAEREASEEQLQRKGLRKIAHALLDKGDTGDIPAIKEIADRLDGKVPQAIVGDSDEDPVNVITRIERVIIDPQPKP